MLHGGECYIVRMVVVGSASNSIFKEMINSVEKVIRFKVKVAFDSIFSSSRRYKDQDILMLLDTWWKMKDGFVVA